MQEKESTNSQQNSTLKTKTKLNKIKSNNKIIKKLKQNRERNRERKKQQQPAILQNPGTSITEQ